MFEQEDRGNVIEVTITNKMCSQDSTVTVSGARYYDWQGDTCSLTPDPDVTSVTNSMSLACGPNTKALCHRKEATIGADEWHIFEVKHRDFFLLRPDGSGVGIDGCPKYTIKQREFSVMTCAETDDPYIIINSVPVTVVSDYQLSNCGLTITYTDICVLGIGGSSSPITYPMTRHQFVTNLQWTSDCKLQFTKAESCMMFPSAVAQGEITLAKMEMVGVGISEDSPGTDPRCTYLDLKEIPV